MAGGKKFGVNNKSEEARAKKTEARRNDADKKARDKEDAMWEEKDEKVLAKQKKAKEMEEKKVQEAKRRAEAKDALEKEEQELKSKYGKGKETTKITRFELEQQKQREERQREAAAAAAAAARNNIVSSTSSTSTTSTTSTTTSGVDSDDEIDLEENINHILREQRLAAGGNLSEATGVDEAIKVLGGPTSDQHPERRLKAAFAKYQEDNLPILRKENPSLKFTQVKDLLWKQWLKSPENPMNQQN
ncbi:hypothetical protein DFA_09907 [Cavenderia fasciculata]|uniref:Coiled-coil domain-containing protein n=1 Tax=Cavenderia fasciculata TaxID=261658 RepID=F4Q8R5_CACFS|nr:uncharacterized protein DFA_09907 [Cavenderia fasciculata]EGG15084.1 hypothetical protein DFA_09907 [Cavenderia fasciculata]|eukprot:XP_004351804.1 hypothetical protein DFA_09907 [Cavenderia fasciculata]